MQKKTQLMVMLKNEPGELARLAKLLAKAAVNIEAVSVNDSVHHAVVKLVTSQAGAARKALARAGVSFAEQPVYSVPLENRPGALAQLCATLAAEGVNLDYVYASVCGCTEKECECGCACQLVVSSSDEKALKSVLDRPRDKKGKGKGKGKGKRK